MSVTNLISISNLENKLGPTEDAIKYARQYNYKGRGEIEPTIELETYLNIIIKKCDLINRSQLAKLSGIPRTTIFDCIQTLCAEERVEKVAITNNKRGRPVIYYKAVKY